MRWSRVGRVQPAQRRVLRRAPYTTIILCWRMLTYADVCWRMLTYADVCWRRLTLLQASATQSSLYYYYTTMYITIYTTKYYYIYYSILLCILLYILVNSTVCTATYAQPAQGRVLRRALYATICILLNTTISRALYATICILLNTSMPKTTALAAYTIHTISLYMYP